MSEKLISERTDKIYGVNTINWESSSWKYLSLIGDEQIINLQRHHSLRIFRLCIVSWKDEREPSIKHSMGRKIGVVQKFTGIQNLGQNWWWANGIRVEYLPRIQYVAAQSRMKHQRFLKEESSSCRCSMGSKDNKRECDSNAPLVSLFARRFGAGQWSFLGPGSEKKWYSISEDSPQDEWDKMAERWWWHSQKADTQSFEPRVHCPESKGGGELSIHCCADQDTITTFFRTIISVNQLSLYGAVAEMCEEYESFHDRAVKPVVGGQSSSSFVPSVIKTNVLLNSDDLTENEFKSNHNKTDWANFVWMQDSWMLLKSDSISWRKIQQNSHNSEMQWPVVSTLCQEMKKHLNRKVGSEGTLKLGPYWKLRPVACKVNMELRSELWLWAETTLTPGSEFLMA